MGDTSKSLGTRFKEHSKLKTPLTTIGEHSVHFNHKIKVDDVQVIARKDHFWKLKIREAIKTHSESNSQ